MKRVRTETWSFIQPGRRVRIPRPPRAPATDVHDPARRSRVRVDGHHAVQVRPHG